MSDDDDHRQANSTSSFPHDTSHRRSMAIKSKLQELTREKTKYNVEKLAQDAEFLSSEIGHLRHSILDMNEKINVQTKAKKALDAEMHIFRSHTGLRYTNLNEALRDKERYERELNKPNKTEEYRNLVRSQLKSIEEALPKLEQLHQFKGRIRATEDARDAARHQREILEESLNGKLQKQTKIRQLLLDSENRLPQIEAEIDKLREERDAIANSTGGRKQRRRGGGAAAEKKAVDSPNHSFAALEQDTLEEEKRQYTEQLEKIRLILKYFHEKMSDHQLLSSLTSDLTPTAELTSPLYNPITPYEEQTILSSFMDERDHSNEASMKKSTYEPGIAIAMKLPRNFAPLNLQSTPGNDIIHSPRFQNTPIEYKKELPSDIIDKYAGISKQSKQQQQASASPSYAKKGKKARKNFGIKHSSQMISLYGDVRTLSGNPDGLPSMPMYEYELPSAIKNLQLIEQSVESYLSELAKRDHIPAAAATNEAPSEIHEDDSIRDSALDSFSETSSLMGSTNFATECLTIPPQLINMPEARSSSSSDDKKTIVSSSSPPSSQHSHSKKDHSANAYPDLLGAVEESPSSLSPLTIQIAQIERQVSDEGYRSVRNGTQQTAHTNIPLLTRSQSYDSTEKVDKWLSTTTPPLPSSNTEENTGSNSDTDFQATDNDNDKSDDLVQSRMSMPEH